MPVIKPYTQRVSPEGQVGGQATGSDFGGPGLHQVGQAVQSAASDTAQAMAIIAHNTARNEATEADLNLTLFGLQRDADLQDRMQKHKLGDPDFTAEALQEFSDGTDKLRYNEQGEEKFTTSLGQRTFAMKQAHLAKTYALKLGQVQAHLQGLNAVESFNKLTAAHSNNVATGENYLNAEDTLRDYELSIRTGVFNTMPSDKREELLRQGKGVIANSAVDGYIRSNPRGARTSLQKGFLAEYLTKDQTSALLDKAQTGVNMQDAADRRAQEALEHATKLASESQATQVGNAYLAARAKPNYNPYDTQREIFKLMGQKEMDNLTGPQIMSMVGALDSDIREAKEGRSKGNNDLDRQLFNLIKDGKMPDITPINNARGQKNNPISDTQHEELIKEFNTARSKEGRSLQEEMSHSLKAVEPMVMPKDLTGVLADPESALKMAKLTSDVRKQVDSYRQQGKDPHVLLDPDAPEYMFTKDRMKKYITPFLERVRAASQRISEAPGLPKTPEGGVAPESQRKPGESIADWQKRTK